MNDALQGFLQTTESTSSGIVTRVSKTLEYPFLYVSRLTTIELEYLVGIEVIERTKNAADSLPLYLKTETGGYKLLGYVNLKFDTVIKMNQLRTQTIMLKTDKETETAVNSIVDSLLLV